MKQVFILLFLFSHSILAKCETADFTYSTANGLFCSPSIIQFNQAATGSPKGFVWTFGNGTGSNSANPLITYSVAGSYTVKLIVIYARTTAVVTKTIVINPTPTASISYDRNYICTPGIINFAAIGSGTTSEYEWNFGDGIGSQVADTNSIAHSFSTLGEYTVTLRATSAAGCFDTTSGNVSVKAIPITGTVSPTSGCIPATVSFLANATIPKNSTADTYLWDFGDGSPVVSTVNNNTNHIYASTGNYAPKVTITTSEGCINTYNLNRTAYGTPPINSVAYPRKATICGSDTAVLIAKATNANSYYWNFGDGTSATVKDTIAKHKYATLGIKNVTMTPVFNGCLGTEVTFQINVEGVIATFQYSNTCIDKKTFSFNNTSQGNLSLISWNFGDSSAILNILNPTHTFPLSGTFPTQLMITDSITGCSDKFLREIYTTEASVTNMDSSICKNSSTTFSVINKYDNLSATYTWDVVGKQVGPLADSFLTIKTTLFGNFNNYVIINNGAGYCKDTLQLNHKILVKGPVLSFDAPAGLCLNDIYEVTNTSKPYIASDSVYLWYWDFGAKQGNDSVYQPQPFVYGNPG
ncbi:MAG: PKD domain-containing protein, partial [Ferruginibacter sp.]